MSDEPVPRGRMSTRRRVVTALVVLLAVALVVGAFWWTGDGQQRRRAVAGLGDLPGVASTRVSDDDRGASVAMERGATAAQVTNVLRRAVPVLVSDDYDLVELEVGLGAAYTDVSARDVGDGGDAAARADVMVALAGLGGGSAYVPPGSPVLLRAGDDDWTAQERLDQVVDALGELSAADEPVPDGLWGDGLLALSEIDVPPETLARALAPLATVLADGVDPESVTGGLVNLDLPDDLGRARAHDLVRSTANQLARVREDGRPVLSRIYAESTDADLGFGIRVG